LRISAAVADVICRCSRSNFVAVNGPQVLELVAALDEVDLVANRTALVNVFTLAPIDPAALPVAATQLALAQQLKAQYDKSVAQASDPPPSHREDRGVKLVDEPVDVKQLVAQHADKAAKQAAAKLAAGTGRKRARGARRDADSADEEDSDAEDADEDAQAAAKESSVRLRSKSQLDAAADKQLAARIHGSDYAAKKAAKDDAAKAVVAAEAAAAAAAAAAAGRAPTFILLGRRCPGCSGPVGKSRCTHGACTKACCHSAQTFGLSDAPGSCDSHGAPP